MMRDKYNTNQPPPHTSYDNNHENINMGNRCYHSTSSLNLDKYQSDPGYTVTPRGFNAHPKKLINQFTKKHKSQNKNKHSESLQSSSNNGSKESINKVDDKDENHMYDYISQDLAIDRDKDLVLDLYLGKSRESILLKSLESNLNLKWATFWNFSNDYLSDISPNIIEIQNLLFDFIQQEQLKYDMNIKFNQYFGNEFLKINPIITGININVDYYWTITFGNLIPLQDINLNYLVNPLLEKIKNNPFINILEEEEDICNIFLNWIKMVKDVYSIYSLGYPDIINLYKSELKISNSNFIKWLNKMDNNENNSFKNLYNIKFYDLLRSNIVLFNKYIIFFKNISDFFSFSIYEKSKNVFSKINELSMTIKRSLLIGEVVIRTNWSSLSQLTTLNNDYTTHLYIHIGNYNENWSNYWQLTENELLNIPINVQKRQFSIFEFLTVEQERYERNQIFIDWYGTSFKNIIPPLINDNNNNCCENNEYWESTFKDWIPIMNVHKQKILDPLLKRVRHEGELINRIDDLLMDWINNAEDLYISYSFNYSKMINFYTIENYKYKKQLQFQKQLQQQQQQQQQNNINYNCNIRFIKWVTEMDRIFHKNIDFNTLLITLLTGLLIKYPIMIKNLIDLTDHKNNEFNQLNLIKLKVENLLKKIENCKRIGEIISMIINNNNNDYGIILKDYDFFNHERLLLKEGNLIHKHLNLKSNSNSYDINNHQTSNYINENCRLFIFDNCVLFCRVVETTPIEKYKIIAPVSIINGS